jgi:hypothetical protein
MCVTNRSERKAFCLRERQRMQQLIGGERHDGPSVSTDSKPGPSLTPLRLPRETSEALQLLYPNMGLGRGINSQRMEETTPGDASFADHSGLASGRGVSR